MALFNKKSAAPQQESKDFALLPGHVGIIMDGNGRWAKKRGLPRSAGHKAGAEVFRTISKACGRIGIPYVTFYAFSTENWKRSPEEVDALMRLFKDYLLEAQADISQAGNIRLKFVGSREGISDELLELMDQGERDTAANTGNQGDKDQQKQIVREARVDCGTKTVHGENPQANGICDQQQRVKLHRTACETAAGKRQKDKNGNSSGGEHLRRILEGGRRDNAENDITNDTAAQRGDNTQGNHAK